MSGISQAVIPAVAALAGVVLAQAWNTWRERVRQRDQIRQLLWVERKESLIRFLIALNQALDVTRKIVLTSVDGEEVKARDRESEEHWAAAFERYMECCIYFPNEAVELVWNQLQAAYAWRRESIASGREQQAPAHEDLIFKVRPLLQLSERDGMPDRFWTLPSKHEHEYKRQFPE
jgi:hypothetical protein